jgi:hypothetical protein
MMPAQAASRRMVELVFFIFSPRGFELAVSARSVFQLYCNTPLFNIGKKR